MSQVHFDFNSFIIVGMQYIHIYTIYITKNELKIGFKPHKNCEISIIKNQKRLLYCTHKKACTCVQYEQTSMLFTNC